MPRVPPRPCRYPGCPELCAPGQVFCKDHLMWSGDRLRGGADARGYNNRWRQERKAFLEQHPLCVECLKEGRYEKATDVDHIIAHRGDPVLFWDESNWQPLCHRHHSEKTRREDHNPVYRY